MISIIHPSRSRPEKSFQMIKKWFDNAFDKNIEIILSLDWDDKTLGIYRTLYQDLGMFPNWMVEGNKSCVQAINRAARSATGDIFVVVSDDTDCFPGWDTALLKEVEGKTDWILKTFDGIQGWIITAPICDRAYYKRSGHIYHPDFDHMFCDTYMTAIADITERKLTCSLPFTHLNSTINDDLRNRTNGTWKQGEETFIRLMKQFSKNDLTKIRDRSIRVWLKNKGII